MCVAWRDPGFGWVVHSCNIHLYSLSHTFLIAFISPPISYLIIIPFVGAVTSTTGMDTSGNSPFTSGNNKLENLPSMVAGVSGNDPAVQTECTTQFRRLLSIEKNPPIQQVIESGVVPRFVEFLQRDDNPALQFEAAWALTNIASGTSEHTKVVMEVGAVPIFVRLLLSPNDDVREQAVWALGNIAGDSPPCRDLVLQAGAMQPLLQQLHQGSKLSMLRNASTVFQTMGG